MKFNVFSVPGNFYGVHLFGVINAGFKLREKTA
jgi:hypothetical protein